MPIPLFLQAITVFDAIDGIIRHVPLYFAQRRPEVLGNFEWIVDGKDPARVTRWEAWWSYYARGALSTRSRNHPAPYLEGADYSHFARFDGAAGVSGESGVDLNLLLANLRFSFLSEAGLELVDILVNAIRRALVGNLARKGWGGIPGLMTGTLCFPFGVGWGRHAAARSGLWRCRPAVLLWRQIDARTKIRSARGGGSCVASSSGFGNILSRRAG